MPGIELLKAFAVSVAPCGEQLIIGSCQTPVTNIAKPVSEQTNKVSIAGLSIETNPSRMGSLLWEAPNAMGAVPIPASLEKDALRTPSTINPPSTPPIAGLQVKL